MVVVVLQASFPYSRTVLRFVLKILTDNLDVLTLNKSILIHRGISFYEVQISKTFIYNRK